MPETLADFHSLMADSLKTGPLMKVESILPPDARNYSIHSGKVWDNIDLRDGRLLRVATDRISTFDVVHPNGIPGKGIVLGDMSTQWKRQFEPFIGNDLITDDVDCFPGPFRGMDSLRGRASLVRALPVPQYECVARGYITGSGLKDYQATGEVCGNQLPVGLVESQQLPEPIFTPATKAAHGHDINISFLELQRRMREDGYPAHLPTLLKYATLVLYGAGAELALLKGMIVADTKFEFGWENGMLVLIDEALTPDSSRYWPAEKYQPGRSQDSLDKQYVRDYAASTGWDKKSEAPHLPEEVVRTTHEKYIEVHDKLLEDRAA